MKITNRTADVLTIGLYNNGAWRTFVGPCDWIHPAQTIEYNLDWSLVDMRIEQGQYDSAHVNTFNMSPEADWVGPFPKDNEILLIIGEAGRTPDARKQRYGAVDFSALRTGAQAQAGQRGAERETIAIVVGVLQALLGAMASSLTAIGTGGFLPSGMAQSVNGMIAVVMNATQEAPPPPPDVEAIAQAVETVVVDALRKDKARDCAVLFQSAANWCLKWGRLAHGPQLAPFDQNVFEKQLIDYMRDSDEFAKDIIALKGDADTATYILPSFAAGLNTYILMKAMYLGLRQLKGATITDDDVAELGQLAESARAALKRTKEAYKLFRDNEINKNWKITTDNISHSGDAIDEFGQLRTQMNFLYLGKDSLDFVIQSRNQLFNVRTKFKIRPNARGAKPR